MTLLFFFQDILIEKISQHETVYVRHMYKKQCYRFVYCNASCSRPMYVHVIINIHVRYADIDYRLLDRKICILSKVQYFPNCSFNISGNLSLKLKSKSDNIFKAKTVIIFNCQSFCTAANDNLKAFYKP